MKTAFLFSITVGYSTRKSLHTTCGSMLITLSLIVDGLLRCPAKFSMKASLFFHCNEPTEFNGDRENHRCANPGVR